MLTDKIRKINSNTQLLDPGPGTARLWVNSEGKLLLNVDGTPSEVGAGGAFGSFASPGGGTLRFGYAATLESAVDVEEEYDGTGYYAGQQIWIDLTNTGPVSGFISGAQYGSFTMLRVAGEQEYSDVAGGVFEALGSMDVNQMGYLNGIDTYSWNEGAGTVHHGYGLNAASVQIGAGTMLNSVGVFTYSGCYSGTMNTSQGLWAQILALGGEILTARAIFVDSPSISGEAPITTYHGLYMADQTADGSTTNFAVNINDKFKVGPDGTTLSVDTSVTSKDFIVSDGDFLIKSTAAFTDGAAAETATLTNAPVAGDPTKWIPISDNGTTRYIPAW